MTTILNSPFTPLEVTRGNVLGATFINKFGRNQQIDTNTDPEDIWDAGGIWAAPTAARIHQIASSDVNDDTDGAGTNAGARTIRIFGLDANFALQEEDITLDGTTNVATNSYTMIYRMQVLTTGSTAPTASNEGNIVATADTDGTVTAQINIGNNQTGMAIYQIPAGNGGRMLNFYGSLADSGGAGANVDIQLLVQPTGGVFQVKQFHGLVAAGAAHFNHIFPVPFPLDAKDTVKMQAKTTSANAAVVSAGFDIIMIAR